MKLQNSYIFLRKSEKNTKTINLDNITNLIKENFNVSEKNIAKETYYKKRLDRKIRVEDIDFEIEFIINEVVSITYLDVFVNHKSKAKAIIGMEYIDNLLTNLGGDFEENHIVIISYDSISEYYCNKIYPKFNELERKLRKLLFNIYIVNFDKSYYTETIEEELQNKIKARIQAKGGKSKQEIERLKMFFYSLEYSDVQNLLFKEKWTNVEKQNKIDFSSKHKDLSMLEDGELRKAFGRVSPKSDWERFFAEKITNLNFNESIDNLRRSRNNVAHSKFFYHDEFKMCKNTINKLNKSIDEAIKITEEEDFTKKNKEALNVIFHDIRNKINVCAEIIGSAILPLSKKLEEFNTNLNPIIRKLGEMFIENESSLNINNDDVENDEKET